ncbi:MAG: PAS domain-containing protein [Owenweeksia sp.]|nr:PAS domain-containing protein [Owenweeksia sp.]
MTQNPAEGKKTLLRSIFSIPAFSSPAKEQGKHEPYLKGVLDLVNSGVLIVKSCNRQIVWCNAAFQQMTGYQAAELAGLDVFHLIPVEWQELLQKNLAELIATGNQQAEHYALLSAEQQEIKVRVKSTLQLVDGEQVVIASFSDITDEQMAFQERERSAIETTALINSIDTYLWSMDLNFNFQQANSKACIMFRELYGINAGPGESYKKVLDKLPDHSAGIWRQKLKQVKASGQAVSFEISEIFINRFAHVKIKIQPISDSRGQIKALSCHVENNTEEYLRHQLLELLGRLKSQMIGVEDTEELLMAGYG